MITILKTKNYRLIVENNNNTYNRDWYKLLKFVPNYDECLHWYYGEGWALIEDGRDIDRIAELMLKSMQAVI